MIAPSWTPGFPAVGLPSAPADFARDVIERGIQLSGIAAVVPADVPGQVSQFKGRVADLDPARAQANWLVDALKKVAKIDAFKA